MIGPGGIFRSAVVLVFCLASHSCKKVDRIESDVSTINIATGDVTFSVIGDYGESGSNAREVSTMVRCWNPDFILTTGDNNYYPEDRNSWQANVGQYYGDFIFNWDATDRQKCNGRAFLEEQNRFFSSPGNHDYHDDHGLIDYLNYFTLPDAEEFYQGKWGPVSFFSINSGDNNLMYDSTSHQAIWLKRELAASTTAWKVVFFHHSPYSSADHGNFPAMQWPFESWGADFVFTGHDHVFSRIQKADEPALTYFICGASGRNKLYTCGSEPLSPNDFDVFCYDQGHGAIQVNATDSTFAVAFYDKDFIDPISVYFQNR